MRYLLALIITCWATVAVAQSWEDQQRFGPADSTAVLRILSSTDTALFAPVLEGFAAENNGLAIDYFVASTADIDKLIRKSPEAFDVAISSAMDLQFKLANDGYAQTLDGVVYPPWAQWRRSLFAFTSEPAAIVVNKTVFATRSMPQTRQDLIRALRDDPQAFKGRVGTYDVRQSGLGYLFATQDARTSDTYWRLTEVMGNLQAKLYCCSGEMIEDVASGRLVVAYNVLASYARARRDLSDRIEIIVPTDFQTVMMRTALVSAQSPQVDKAQAFMTYLLDQRFAVPGQGATLPFLELEQSGVDPSTIPLEPALLTYLDRLKSQRFIAEWTDAIIQ